MKKGRSGLMGAVVLAACLWAQSAAAVPPVAVRGIDLPTVLALYDRGRQLDHHLDRRITEESAERRELSTLRTIVLDPGHGGDNNGAVGVHGINEKYLTLELAYALRDRLQRAYPDTRVVLTRYWDQSVGLSERIHHANTIGADLFLSLHYNAAVHDRAVGFETYFLVESEAIPGQQEVEGEPIAATGMEVTGIDRAAVDRPTSGTYNDVVVRMQRDLARQIQHRDSGHLAETVQAELDRQLSSINRGVKQANFAVLRGALMPAVVVEAGFLTHPEEGQAIFAPRHQERVVDALFRAVGRFDRELTARRR